jgi:hypothetical protein
VTDYKLQLPGRPAVELKNWGNLPIELLAHAAGVKEVTQCWLQEADAPYLDQLKAGLGLEALVYTKTGGDGQPVRLGVMVGQDKSLLQAAADAWQAPRSNPGPNLGYPVCCSEFYCSWIDDRHSGAGREDVVFRIARATKDRRAMPFLLNDAYYLYSRPWSEGEPERREALYRANPGLPTNLLNVVPWHPCSYRCPAALDKAQKIWAVMQSQLPQLAGILKSCLARPVIFWDWDKFAALKGVCDDEGSCTYTSVQPPFAALDPKVAALLRSGDQLRTLKSGALTVYKSGKKLGELPAPAVLLDFAA